MLPVGSGTTFVRVEYLAEKETPVGGDAAGRARLGFTSLRLAGTMDRYSRTEFVSMEHGSRSPAARRGDVGRYGEISRI